MSKYKVGDKVVMEIISADQDEIKTYSVSGVDNNWRWRLPQNLLERYTEPLSTYTEPLEAKIRRQAAEITRLLAENKELKEQMKFDLPTLISEEDRRRMDINKARAEGAEAAWELAKKFVLYGKGCYSDEEVKKIFGFACGPTVLRNYTYKHAATKVAEWEKAKEEIKVGDVCMSNTGNCFAIRTIDHEKGNVEILWKDLSSGIVTLDFIKSHCTNTDRHIDIDSISQQIGGKEK